ncbi:uncharacterized protein LAESUDRAFT_765451 [Laetiporus sulphureus 93-53]|uniref:Uncharacterized protein n=1 Tax=Laetiporus sulphureus 93-53 TaxID=1314785 RepID=A0A165ARA9_9APHY|nr:uncharacterized protein LAESUDRAFT_765451 [Laetiporus sulphureus 93-53]KZS99509.1 hypothetical protein LAESUDRAFT_765451 [Laetiporus sulphureus 93-53]
MAPRRWTTEEEYTFLNNLYPQYLKAQKKGHQDPFFIWVEHEWFEAFSEHKKVFGHEISTLMDEQETQLHMAITARQKQLREWFRNRNASARCSGAAPKSSLNMNIATKPAGRRCLKGLELYSRKYYRTRVQPAVKKIIMEQSLSSKETLHVIKQLTAKMFEKEDDEIKAEIQAEYDAQEIHQNEDAGEASEALPTPMQCQEFIDSMPAMLKELFSELSRKTGWCFTVIGGGPCPEEDGEIRTIWYVLLLLEDQGHKSN